MGRPGVGALATGLVGLSVWYFFGIDPRHVLGVGEQTLTELMSQEGNPVLSVWWILLVLVAAKTLTTGLTLMSGGSAGLLVPAMFIGGVSGAAVHYGLVAVGIPAGPDASLFVVAGIASGLVGVVDVPLAAITFVLEVFGAHFGPPAIVAVVVCHMVSRRLQLYDNFVPGEELSEAEMEQLELLHAAGGGPSPLNNEFFDELSDDASAQLGQRKKMFMDMIAQDLPVMQPGALEGNWKKDRKKRKNEIPYVSEEGRERFGGGDTWTYGKKRLKKTRKRLKWKRDMKWVQKFVDPPDESSPE